LHSEGKGKMVNPAKLDAARRDSVCAQCHLSGEARVERAGRKFADYRPGDLLSDYVAYFVATGQGDLQVNSHVEKLSKSGCKRAAGDRLWCGTCHDPHRVPAAAERAGWFRGRCLTCHKAADCERGFDCVSCHMPRSSAADAVHGVFTDHSIPRVAARTRLKAAPSWQLAGFSAVDRGARELGLAYADVGARSGDRRQQAEAIRLLTGLPEDVEVEVRLGDLLERTGSPERAMALYRSALRKDPNAVVALVNLGRLYGSQGHLDEAIALWREALKRNPCLFEAGANLQIALRAKGDVGGAEAVERAQSFCVFE
jgi:tetratricopeptide (TPR) repeat protein